MKNIVSMILVVVFSVPFGDLNAQQTVVQKIKSAVANPVQRARTAMQHLQEDINCVYTNSCTAEQKSRIKKYVTAVSALLTTALAVGTVGGIAYGSLKTSKLKQKEINLILQIWQNYSLTEDEKLFLKDIAELPTASSKDLDNKTTQVRIAAYQLTSPDVFAAIELLGKLSDFKDKWVLQEFFNKVKQQRETEQRAEEYIQGK